MNNFLKSKKAKGILANLSDVIKSNSVKENLDQFEVLNLDQIFSSFNNINQADDYHEHLDGQDFSYDADDVEAAFNEYNQLKKQFEEKYFSVLLFKQFVLEITVYFVLVYFSLPLGQYTKVFSSFRLGILQSL